MFLGVNFVVAYGFWVGSASRIRMGLLPAAEEFSITLRGELSPAPRNKNKQMKPLFCNSFSDVSDEARLDRNFL